MKITRALLILVTSVLCTDSFASVIAFDNINRTPGEPPYDSSGYWAGFYPELGQTISNVGVSFTPSVTGTLTSIEAPIFIIDSQYTGTGLSWSIFSYDGLTSDLGTPLWESGFNQPIPSVFDSQLQFFDTSDGPLLQQGENYWLVFNAVIDGQTVLRWSSSNTGITADFRIDALNTDGNGFTNYFETNDPPAFALHVNPVPIPTAFWLFASGLLAFGLPSIGTNWGLSPNTYLSD